VTEGSLCLHAHERRTREQGLRRSAVGKEDAGDTMFALLCWSRPLSHVSPLFFFFIKKNGFGDGFHVRPVGYFQSVSVAGFIAEGRKVVLVWVVQEQDRQCRLGSRIVLCCAM